jgi:hypothetical protein
MSRLYKIREIRLGGPLNRLESSLLGMILNREDISQLLGQWYVNDASSRFRFHDEILSSFVGVCRAKLWR